MRRLLKAWIPFWPLLLPALLLLPGLGGFPYPSADAQYSDFSISHFSNALFLQRSLAEDGQVPLWSPTILSGYPFAANPLSGLWYPPGWLALALPLPFGLNLMAMLHLLWGAVGMYGLLRAMGRSQRAAVFGGMVFGGLPKVFAHYGAGHLTLVYAFMWTPWLLLAEARKERGEGRFWTRQPSIVLGLIILADVRWGAYAGVLWVAFTFVHRARAWQKKLWEVMKQGALALALAAPLLLPLLEYARLSTRAHLSSGDTLRHSLPPVRLVGLIFHQLAGNHEWVLYAGLLVLALALLSFWMPTGSRNERFWGLVLGTSLLWSLGSAIPGMRWIASLPGIDLLRVPPRALTLTGMALTVLASGALDIFLSGRMSEQDRARLRLLAAAFFGLGLIIPLSVWISPIRVPAAFLLLAVICLLAGALLWLWAGKRISAQAFWLAMMLITAADLAWADLSYYTPHRAEAVLGEDGQAAAFLAAQPGPFRVYSPSYSVAQQTAAWYRLEIADGVDPLQLEPYAAFMEAASGVPRQGYSVALPPLQDGNPRTANVAFTPDAELLRLLNVRFVAAQFEIQAQGLELVVQFGETRVYEVAGARPRAYMLGDGLREADIVEWTPNRIVLGAEGPGRLVLAELDYPGWRVWVDGQKREIEAYEGLFRSVELGVGEHRAEFHFRPISVYAGIGISILALVLLALLRRRDEVAPDSTES